MPEKAKVPAIRFKGFTDAWEQRKVKDLFKVTRGNVLAATLTSEKKTEDASYPVYSSQTKQNGLMGYYKEFLYEDAITWTTDGSNAGTVNYRAGKFYCTNVCGVLLSNEIKANQMIAEALNNIAKKYVSYVGNPKLMNNVMADIEIKLPSQEKERDTISSFFCDLDNLITLHQRKLLKLKNVKKAMLEKMFPKNGSNVPEIRFAGFTDAWEQRKLGELCDVYDGTHQTPNYQNNGIMFLSVENINSLKSEKYISEEDFIKDFNIFPEKGDVLMTRIGDIGTANVVESNEPKAYYVSLALLKKKALDPYFLKESISSETVKNDLWKRTLHIAFPKKINKNEIAEVLVPYPEKRVEQEQIGMFFKNLENLITLHQRKYEKLQNLKKACLEKMFV